MSKSILVIDTPKSCMDCNYICNEFENKTKGNVENDTWEWLDHNILPQCPLQDTTEIFETLNEMEIPSLFKHLRNKIGFDMNSQCVIDIIETSYNKLNKALRGDSD